MLPAAFMMAFLSQKFFLTIFVPTGKFTVVQANEAGTILAAYLIGLSSIALNKILLNVYYALHSAWIPFCISIITTLVNIGANIMLIGPLGAAGLALATSLSVIIQTVLLVIIVHYHFKLRLYFSVFADFFMRYCIQLFCVLLPLFIVHQWLHSHIVDHGGSWSLFFTERIGFWLWTGPVCGMALVVIFVTRRLFGIKLYFID
jgi:peptidoglycan biosynthesis protein MviN/MurJ (putative lipid II flippase)